VLNSPPDDLVKAPEANGSGILSMNFTGISGATQYAFSATGYNDILLSPGFAGQNFEITLTNVPTGTPIDYFITATPGGETSCVQTVTFDVAAPVEWQSFTATAVGKTAQLNWSVIQDAQHAGFTIERRLEEATSWTDLQFIIRSGPDGAAEYAFTDTSVEPGATYYYRLRQTDVDGSVDYSPIRSVSFDASGGRVSIFPNPTRTAVQVEVGTNAPARLRYTLFTALGQQIQQGILNPDRTDIDLEKLPAAVYQLVVTDGQGYREVLRVVKL